MSTPRIEIKTTGAKSKVYINGQYVPGVGKIEEGNLDEQ